MSIDASAVARVLGVSTEFKDLREDSILFLPQRIAIFAQGASAVTYPTTKLQVTSSKQVGDLYGYGSPVHLVARQLFPANGDGVGTIPVTVYPLEDPAAAGVAATGDITASGTAAAAEVWNTRIAGVLGTEFSIPLGAIVVDDVHRFIQRSITARLESPTLVTHTYGSLTATPDGGNAGDGTLDTLSATADPFPGAWVITCNTAAVDGGLFTLVDPDGNVVSTTIDGSIGTPQEFGGITMTFVDGAADWEVDDFFDIDVPSTDVQLAAKWQGSTGNDIAIEMVGPSGSGVSFAVTVMNAGAGTVAITAALAQVGNIWESMALNALRYDDTTTLEEFRTFGEGRWGELVRKPLAGVFCGNTVADQGTATLTTAARTGDRVNSQLVAPGSPTLPFVVAARELARIARVANNKPMRDYGSQKADGITPGLDSVQWDYPTRDAAVKNGSSTIDVRDSVVHLADTVTMYAPIGETPPAYRYVTDIVKLQQIHFNTALLFENEEWDGAALVPSNQATVTPEAKTPEMAIAEVAGMIDALALQAIISDPAKAKKTITAVIDGGNPKRLNISFTVQLAGNTNIIDVTLNFGFFFGSAVAA